MGVLRAVNRVIPEFHADPRCATLVSAMFHRSQDGKQFPSVVPSSKLPKTGITPHPILPHTSDFAMCVIPARLQDGTASQLRAEVRRRRISQPEPDNADATHLQYKRVLEYLSRYGIR